MNEQQGLDPMFQENGSQWMEGGLASEPLNVYTAKTFGWMFLGLLVTFGTAIAFSAGGGLYYLLTMGMPAVFALAIAEIVVVMVLSARLHKLSIGAARGLFFAYAVLNGLNLSSIFLAYDFGSLILAFLVGAVYFGVMAVYGNVTNRDLTGWGPKLMGGLVALIVCGLVGGLFSLFGFGFGKGYPADRVEAEQSNKKILDGVRAVAFKPLIEILKGIDQDLLKGAIAGEHFQEQFFADCKDPELAAYVKTLL